MNFNKKEHNYIESDEEKHEGHVDTRQQNFKCDNPDRSLGCDLGIRWAHHGRRIYSRNGYPIQFFKISPQRRGTNMGFRRGKELSPKRTSSYRFFSAGQK